MHTLTQHTPSLPPCKHRKRMEPYHDSAGSGAGDPVLAIIHSFISWLLQLFSPCSFYLGITIIKSSGSNIEFESLYFSPIVIFHPSCHSNRKHFSLLARQILSFAVLVFSIFTIKYAELAPFGNQRRWTMSKRIFNYTVPSEEKKVRWNYALLYGS